MSVDDIKIDVLGKALFKARQDAGLSQVDIGKILGVDYKTISAYEKGRIRIPGVFLLKVAKTLNMSLDHLLGMEFPKMDGRTKHAKFLKELEKIEQLSPEEQKAVFTMIDSMASHA